MVFYQSFPNWNLQWEPHTKPSSRISLDSQECIAKQQRDKSLLVTRPSQEYICYHQVKSRLLIWHQRDQEKWLIHKKEFLSIPEDGYLFMITTLLRSTCWNAVSMKNFSGINSIKALKPRPNQLLVESLLPSNKKPSNFCKEKDENIQSIKFSASR